MEYQSLTLSLAGIPSPNFDTKHGDKLTNEFVQDGF